MSKDITKSEMLIGKTKSEVIEILGDEENKMTDDTWHYYLGFVPRFLSIDPDIIIIRFENNQVVEVTQRET